MTLHHLCCSVLFVPTFTCRFQSTARIVVEKSSSHALPRPGFECMAVNTTKTTTPIVRRSASYKPSIWDYDYIQKLTTEFEEESYVKRAEKLKEDVRMVLIKQAADPLQQLEIIDDLKRLGLSYHFENEIKRILNKIYNDESSSYNKNRESLYATTLIFRLLRQHDFDISQEIFDSFRDDNGNFKSSCGEDSKGILSLYDAAYLMMEGENMFEDIINFTTPYLQEYTKSHEENEYLCTLVKHSLELPLHWRMLRSETRWFIDVYQRNPNMNPSLLEFAILDFNILQAQHQEELKHVARWWRNINTTNNFSFARDRLLENFLWSTGMAFEPQFGYIRKKLTKILSLATVLDDIYDVHGTLDELELFTDIVERWDVTAMDALPNYMKIWFLALRSIVNEFAFDFLKEHGINIIPHLKKGWGDLCKSYIVEARWYYNNYTPSFEEYLDNAWISVTGPNALLHGLFFTMDPTKKEALECLLMEYPTMIRSSSMICRLINDLATSSAELKRGDVAKSIQCYMNDTGASEVDAREHIKDLIKAEWMKLNKAISESYLFSYNSIGITMNFTKTTLFFYRHRDGFGDQDLETKDHVLSLIVNPISYLPIKK